MTRVAAIVLAAGAGRRFGAPKALVTFRGEHLVTRALRLAVSGGCDPVVVVLGADAERVREHADLSDAEIVVAADWATGMSASLRAGLAAVTAADEVAAAVVLLVDQPLLGAAAIGRLREAWSAGAAAGVATYDGNPRNPVIVDRRLWEEIAAAAYDDVGARAWLRAHPEQVVEVDCTGTGDPADIDTPEDLARLA